MRGRGAPWRARAEGWLSLVAASYRHNCGLVAQLLKEQRTHEIQSPPTAEAFSKSKRAVAAAVNQSTMGAPAAVPTFGSARMAANSFGAAAPAANPPTFGGATPGQPGQSLFGQAPLRDAFGQVRDEPNANRANPGVVGDDQFVPLLDGGGGD